MVAPPEPVSELVPEPIPLDIVYEDEHFLALNKQADLIVHPARGRWTGTLVNGLVYYGKKWTTRQRQLAAGHPAPPRPQHHRHHARRQERRSPLAHRPAVRKPHDPEDLHRRRPRRARTAQPTSSTCPSARTATSARNRPSERRRTAASPRSPSTKSRKSFLRASKARSRSQRSGSPTTRSPLLPPLTTTTHPSDRQHPTPPGKFSLIKLNPKTGRTHQLRVHMSAIGYPMVGDTMYGGRHLPTRPLPLRPPGPPRLRNHLHPPRHPADHDPPGPPPPRHDPHLLRFCRIIRLI